MKTLDISSLSDATPTDEFEKVPLTEEGKRVISDMATRCLAKGIAPNCTVSGQDGSCVQEILSINELELADLIEKHGTATQLSNE